MNKFQVPILYITFNRIETVRKTFPQIKNIKPEKLFISCDGPRNNVTGEYEKVQEVRNYIKENIDWDCDVKYLFQEKNLGVKKAPSDAINWFFDTVDYGIILEDDCLANEVFFTFCEEILKKYKDDARIMHVCGSNIDSNKNNTEDYFFSTFCGIWGWATWKRAWKLFDIQMAKWPELGALENFDYPQPEKEKFIQLYDKVYRSEINTIWDFQWDFSCKSVEGLAVIPKVNLISNIGFIENATNTNKNDENGIANMEKYDLHFPLKENSVVSPNIEYDNKYIRMLVSFWMK